MSERAGDVAARQDVNVGTRHRLPWAMWPWQQCRAVAVDAYLGTHRCERRKGHDGTHAREYGMEEVCWKDPVIFRRMAGSGDWGILDA